MTTPQVTISLDPAAVSLVLEGLAQLPLHRSMDLFVFIRDQARQQIEQHQQQKPPEGAEREVPHG